MRDILKLGDTIKEPWSPQIIAQLNGQDVKLAVFEGEFPWHLHEKEDEMFMVVRGSIILDISVDGKIESEILNPWQMFTVPRGMLHRPRAQNRSLVLLFEPSETVNTGNLPENHFTKNEPPII